MGQRSTGEATLVATLSVLFVVPIVDPLLGTRAASAVDLSSDRCAMTRCAG